MCEHLRPSHLHATWTVTVPRSLHHTINYKPGACHTDSQNADSPASCHQLQNGGSCFPFPLMTPSKRTRSQRLPLVICLGDALMLSLADQTLSRITSCPLHTHTLLFACTWRIPNMLLPSCCWHSVRGLHGSVGMCAPLCGTCRVHDTRRTSQKAGDLCTCNYSDLMSHLCDAQRKCNELTHGKWLRMRPMSNMK